MSSSRNLSMIMNSTSIPRSKYGADSGLTVELGGARANVWAWHFISHASAPARCLASRPFPLWLIYALRSGTATRGFKASVYLVSASISVSVFNTLTVALRRCDARLSTITGLEHAPVRCHLWPQQNPLSASSNTGRLGCGQLHLPDRCNWHLLTRFGCLKT
jgi:hypothetical protein